MKITLESIKHRDGPDMIESLYQLWSNQLRLFMDEADKVDPRDMGAFFEAQRDLVKQFNNECQAKNALSNVHTICTRANLEMLSNLVRRCIDYGIGSNIPEWTFVVSQFHLFVMEVERTSMFREQAHSGDHAMGVNPHMHTLLRRVGRI